jgi:heme exporter protein CcmD
MDVLHAGKYAAYVYSAYGLSALVLIGAVAQSLWAARIARRRAEGEPK